MANKLAVFVGGPFDGSGMLVAPNTPYILIPVSTKGIKAHLIDLEVDLLPMDSGMVFRTARYEWQPIHYPPYHKIHSIETKVQIYLYDGTYDR